MPNFQNFTAIDGYGSEGGGIPRTGCSGQRPVLMHGQVLHIEFTQKFPFPRWIEEFDFHFPAQVSQPFPRAIHRVIHITHQ